MANGKYNVDVARKRVVTPIGRLAFPHVFEPKTWTGKGASKDQKPSYQAIMIFPANLDLKKIAQDSKISLWDAYMAGMEELWGADPKKWPKDHQKPWRPGSEKGSHEGFSDDVIFIQAKADGDKKRPQVVDAERNYIDDPSDLYAGCYVRAELIAYPYDFGSNRGVGFTLMNIQKVKDGRPFSGRKGASDVFSAPVVPDDLSIAEDGEEGDDADADDGNIYG